MLKGFVGYGLRFPFIYSDQSKQTLRNLQRVANSDPKETLDQRFLNEFRKREQLHIVLIYIIS